MPPEIIFPKDLLVILDTSLDSANPIFFATFMCSLDMTLQETLVGQALVANNAAATLLVVAFRTFRYFNRRRGMGCLIDIFPRMRRIRYRRMGNVVYSRITVARRNVMLSTGRNSYSSMETVGTLALRISRDPSG
jgi:hypothetical protein